MFGGNKILPNWYLILVILIIVPLSFCGYIGVAFFANYIINDINLACGIGVISFIIWLNLFGLFADWMGFCKLNLGIEDKRRK
jgi:hypothetical protein